MQKYSNEIILKKEDSQKDNLTKQFIEILVKDILLSNPKLEFDKGVFILKTDKKVIETERVSINYYRGFTTRFVETEKGNYINVSLKNKIESTQNILEYLQKRNYRNQNNQYDIKNKLEGRLFYFEKKKYKIDEILFDRNPKNQTIYVDGKNISILEYYSKKYNFNIKDFNQPLILNIKNGPQGKKLNSYYIPELCTFSGLDEQEQQDGFFMKELSKTTKIDPMTRIELTNKFLEFLKDPDKIDNNQLSAKEKSDLYGIEVKLPNEPFRGYLMKETKLIAGNNKKMNVRDKMFPVLNKKDMTSWICFYEKSNYNDADTLFKCLSKASKAFDIDIAEPEWIEMNNNSTAKNWKDTADDYFQKNQKSQYDFAIFLLGKNTKIYNELKKHSLCNNGYVSQIVKAKSLKSKGMMSTCSKILLQINAKLGGVSYKTIIDKPR
jgi:aubergine-like protein